jgi:hypothetical protein
MKTELLPPRNGIDGKPLPWPSRNSKLNSCSDLSAILVPILCQYCGHLYDFHNQQREKRGSDNDCIPFLNLL